MEIYESNNIRNMKTCFLKIKNIDVTSTSNDRKDNNLVQHSFPIYLLLYTK